MEPLAGRARVVHWQLYPPVTGEERIVLLGAQAAAGWAVYKVPPYGSSEEVNIARSHGDWQQEA